MSDESFIDKVKDFIKGHPDQADQGLDKGEEILNERTGGQYGEQIAKGDDVVREQLGIPDDSTTAPQPPPGEPTPTPGTTPEPPAVPDPIEPGQVPEPTEPGTTPTTTPPQTVPDPAPDTNET